MGSVTNSQIRFTVKCVAKSLNYDKRGIPIDRVDTHSLRSGGACALKLAGHDDSEIRKIGRWKPKSDDLLEYIQQQLSTCSKGMTTHMSRISTFATMKGSTEREDPRPQPIF